MKKSLIILAGLFIFLGSTTNKINSGAIGLQLGDITFGLGGSENGPIIGVGRSPNNGLAISFPFVPNGYYNNNYYGCNNYY